MPYLIMHQKASAVGFFAGARRCWAAAPGHWPRHSNADCHRSRGPWRARRGRRACTHRADDALTERLPSAQSPSAVAIRFSSSASVTKVPERAQFIAFYPTGLARTTDPGAYRWKLHLPKDYFVTAPPPPPGEFVVSPLDPSSERGPCAPPRGPFLKICFFRYTRLHTSRVRALETASFTLEGAAATCEETAMDETMVVLLTHGARQVERALRRALHCPQQHSKLPAPHLLALVP